MTSPERDEADSSQEEGALLETAFKKLKVDPQWSEDSIVDDVSTKTLRDLWSGKGSKTRSRSKCRGKSRQKQRKSSKRSPYVINSLPSMDKLTISQEACSCSSCNHCHETGSSKQAFGLDLSQRTSTSPLLREARLKLHHREKDQRSVIAKAKLKLKATREKTRVQHGAGTMPTTIFGAKHKLESFTSVLENKDDEVDKTSSPSAPFEPALLFDHADELSDSLSDVTSRLCLSVSSTASKKPTNTIRSRDTHKLHRTCSQEAKLDEMAVDELAGYFEDFMYIPKKMSDMAEMMYT